MTKVDQEIMKLIAQGVNRPCKIAERLGKHPGYIASRLGILKDYGRIRNKKYGEYEISEE